MPSFKIGFLFLVLIMVQCTSEVPYENTSFYYWKTNYQLTSYESNYLKELSTKKIYFKAFDVVEGEPVGVLQWLDTVCPDIEYIPTVFIDYEVFKEIDTATNEKLAENIYKLVSGICKNQKFDSKEIQIDCDWTKGVSENYFYFLKYLKRHSALEVSVTIRLHQLKYKEQTGTPPCDYGVLMCYNMGDLKSPEAENSIYKFNILKSYLHNVSYELDLKAALPIFNWMLWYRGERFMGILPRQKYLDSFNLKVGKRGSVYLVNKDIEINEHLFEMGDIIRDEIVTPKELMQLKNYLRSSNLKLSNEIIYFSLDSLNLSQYEKSLFTP